MKGVVQTFFASHFSMCVQEFRYICDWIQKRDFAARCVSLKVFSGFRSSWEHCFCFHEICMPGFLHAMCLVWLFSRQGRRKEHHVANSLLWDRLVHCRRNYSSFSLRSLGEISFFYSHLFFFDDSFSQLCHKIIFHFSLVFGLRSTKTMLHFFPKQAWTSTCSLPQ